MTEKGRWGVLILLLGLSLSAAAQEVRPFGRGSLAEIEAARGARPFVLTLWSLTCSHCAEELTLLARLAARYPDVNVVLVSTDGPDAADAIDATVLHHGLDRAESWVFADFAERLRYEIDPRWYGELPRTYLYRPGEERRTLVGRVNAQRLESWFAQSRP